MSTQSAKLLVTAATGQLGRLVVQQLMEKVSADRIAVTVRDPAKASDLAKLGITVRGADYKKIDTLNTAFTGVDKLLLISGTDLGSRVAQHQNVIDAAKRTGVGQIIYTSVLRADKSTLGILADEHYATEKALAESGIPFVILRNGWYTENRLSAVPAALATGAVHGAAGQGRFSFAARADYAAAAAAVLTTEGHTGKIYELAGDAGITLTDFAAEIAKQTGKPVTFKNLTESDYAAALESAGLPKLFAQLIAKADACAAKGELFDDSKQLNRLIGRPTTPMAATIAEALRTGAPAPAH